MHRKALIVITAAAALLLAGLTTGCKKLEARDNLNKGVQAFKGAKYGDAVDFFKKAIDLDPTYPTARLYLATSYMSQYIPGADSPENNEFASQAAFHFQKILETEPGNTSALKSLASLAFQQTNGMPTLAEKMKQFDVAAEWYKKLAKVDPKEKEAFYSLGVVAWSKFYPAWMEARTKLGMKPETPGPIKDKKVRDELKEKYTEVIGEGIKNLEQALVIDKEYDDAMAYLNLLYRERADIADDAAGYAKDTEMADGMIAKALETRKVKADRSAQSSSGIVQEEKK